MNFIEKLIVAMLVFFGLAFTTNLDAQTRVWDDRYEAVDDLGDEYNSLVANPNSYTAQEVALLMRAYWELMTEIDDAEDTEQGYLNAETKWDAEKDARDPNGDYDQDYQRLKDHLLDIISTQ